MPLTIKQILKKSVIILSNIKSEYSFIKYPVEKQKIAAKKISNRIKLIGVRKKLFAPLFGPIIS